MNKANDENNGLFLFIVFICMMCAIIGFALGFNVSDGWARKEAVKNGAAEWVASEHGSPEFKWKVKNEQK